MSSPVGASQLSPFVRGTTNPAVYYLQNGTARLVPDAATLTYMSAGQQVRTLSDADMAALPKGVPLPSRTDSTLLIESVSAATQAGLAFLMQGGLKRRIPDAQTVAAIENGGVQSHLVSPADAATIPDGTPMPSRADGTVYQGTGGTFAYLVQKTLKCAVPDATTLRDAGHDPSTALPISAPDLAAIPNGNPLPSTSKFLHPPSAQVPLLLLPVRLETAFSGNELWVRIFPDTVHANSFEAALTDDEASARAQFLAIASSDTSARKAAFAALVRQFGTARAAYLSSGDATTATKAADWTIAPFTNLLPNAGSCSDTTARRRHRYWRSAARSRIRSRSGRRRTDRGQRVTLVSRGFGTSTRRSRPAWGFASRCRQARRRVTTSWSCWACAARSRPPTQVLVSRRSCRRIITVTGWHCCRAMPRRTTPRRLPRRIPQPTRITTPSSRSSKDRRSAPSTDRGRRPAARALGIDPATFAHVSGANGGGDEQAAAMNAALWPATWGYYLEQLVTGSVPNPDTTQPAVRDHFAAYVRARGHYPALMAGRQPYGVLPVCWSAQWAALQSDPVQTQLAPLLAKVRATWENSVTNVPRLTGASDAEAALVAVLGMTPSSVSYAARGMIGPEYAFTFFNFANTELDTTWWAALAKKTAPDAAMIGGALPASRLANATYIREPRSLGSELVADAPLAGQPAPAYVAQLAAMGWQALRDATAPQTPAPLFFYLLRYAALRAYVDAAFDLLLAANGAQPAERIEAELVGFDATRPDAWSVLERTLPGRGAVGTVLDGLKQDPSVPAFAAFWKAFGALATFSAADLDAATREVFDLASYRLDSWISSLAESRLDHTRAANPNGGIVIGGYGWLENVRSATTPPASTGYVHAPSVDRAVSAAVLRSGYLAHAGDAGRPFALDLSSQRVRLGLHLLAGMRAGQSLGALLGYRFERALHEAGLDRFIDAFRAVAPSGAANALDVVDGLALVRGFQTSATFWSAAGLPASGTPERTSATAVLETVANAVDAVADLSLAESVHQLTRGNTLRAGAALDTIARGDGPPPDIDFVDTPRSGIASTYRVLSLALETTATGWASTPRAAAEPRLNSWAAALLGDPSRVRLRVAFAATPSPVTAEFGFNELNLAPLDVLALPEAANGGSDLVARILAAAGAHRPTGVTADAAPSLVSERNPAWTAQTIGLGEWLVLAQATARVVNGARALGPPDFAGPNDTPVAVDTAELQARADAAESQVRAASTALAQSPVTAAALLGAAAFGVSGAIPATDATAWPAQAAAALADLTARTAALDALANGFNRSTAAADMQVVQDISRLRATFGSSFVVLPAFAAAATASFAQLWANSASLQGGDAFASTRFLQRAARVRAGLARMDAAMLLAESLAGAPFALPSVAQLPAVAGDRWGGLDTAPPPTNSTLSLVAWTPGAQPAGAQIAGLLIDEWIDVVPATTQTTGVALDYPDPGARAPQAILLAVAPDTFPEWTLESVEGSVLEALDLAKIRGVDPDALGALGHYLPALYFPYNATNRDSRRTVDRFHRGARRGAGGDWLMASITTWNRIEPRARSGDLSEGLAARAHDPLWLLCRQWQVGEFAGHDGGSPILASFSSSTTALDRCATGTGAAGAYDGSTRSRRSSNARPCGRRQRAATCGKPRRRACSSPGCSRTRMSRRRSRRPTSPRIRSAHRPATRRR